METSQFGKWLSKCQGYVSSAWDCPFDWCSTGRAQSETQRGINACLSHTVCWSQVLAVLMSLSKERGSWYLSSFINQVYLSHVIKRGTITVKCNVVMSSSNKSNRTLSQVWSLTVRVGVISQMMPCVGKHAGTKIELHLTNIMYKDIQYHGSLGCCILGNGPVMEHSRCSFNLHKLELVPVWPSAASVSELIAGCRRVGYPSPKQGHDSLVSPTNGDEAYCWCSLYSCECLEAKWETWHLKKKPHM